MGLPYYANGPWRLPTMLYSCRRLTSLKIHASSARLALPEQLWNLLSTLSALQHLHLECLEADEWLFEPEIDPDFSAILFGEEEDSVSPNAHPSSTPTSRVLRPIAEAMPNLEYLHLETRHAHFEPHHIPFLPKSLTYLELPCNERMTAVSLPYYHECPNMRTIRVLVTHHEQITGVLAPSITSVSFWGGANLAIPSTFWKDCNLIEFFGDATAETIKQLPKSVEIVKCAGLWHTQHWSSHDCMELLKAISLPNLKYLKFPNNYDLDRRTKQWTPFPSPTIETLHLFGSYQHFTHVLDVEPRMKLPTMLQTLIVDEITRPAALFAGLAELSSLTFLQFQVRGQCFESPDFLTNLPESLTHLDYKDAWGSNVVGSVEPILINSAIPKLPRKLQRFTICNRLFYMTSGAIKDLPKHLNILSVAVVFDADCEPQEHILELPRYIATLNIIHALPLAERFNSRSIGPVSPTKTLKGNVDNSKWTFDMFKNLPLQSLTTLSIMNTANTCWTSEMMKLLHPTDLGYLRFNRGVFEEDAVASLPRGLTSFLYEGDTPLSGKCIPNLPPRMVRLTLPETFDVDEKELTLLPSQLYSLTLSQKLPHLNELSARFLPASVCLVAHEGNVLYRGLRSLISAARSAPLDDRSSKRVQHTTGYTERPKN